MLYIETAYMTGCKEKSKENCISLSNLPTIGYSDTEFRNHKHAIIESTHL